MNRSLEILTRPYLVTGTREIQGGLTIAQGVDLFYWQQLGATSLIFFTKPLPVALSFHILETLKPIKPHHRIKGLRGLMGSLQLSHVSDYQQIALKGREEVTFQEGYLEELLKVLEGRLLYPQEILASLRERRVKDFPLIPYLQFLFLKKKILLYPSLSKKGKGFICLRCGGEEVEGISCRSCSLEDFVCTSCKIMGESRLCRPLFGQEGGPPLLPHTSSYKMGFQLSPFQSLTSKKLKGLVVKEEKKRVLFWAVCGAGKTEVTFPLMDSFLKRGLPVLLTLPRRDVVHQLGERIKGAFSPLKVVILSGSTPTRFEQGLLVVATTHQVIRFYHYFHLVILDEFDAFPYPVEPMLDHAIRRSLVPGGHLVYMSATPDQDFRERVDRGEWGFLRLPLRFHHHPLPEPELCFGDLQGMMGGRPLLPQLFRFLYQSLLIQRVQVFLFVPTKALTNEVQVWLKGLLKEIGLMVRVDAVHSKTPKRDEKIAAFFAGETRIMVTTTILERGVTIPRCHVLVFFACYERIFNTQTLVQLSGRTGRSIEYPKGEVLFCGERISPSMEEARYQIKELNQWAKERGLFRG